MRVVHTALPGVVLIEPVVHRDGRGFFVETYHAERYCAAGIDLPFVQDNHSKSRYGTVRGLHIQVRRPQGKLLRVLEGAIYDVAVDVRRGSPTFGQWVAVTLTAETFLQYYVPPGFAHGFCVTSEVAQIEYKCTDIYDPTAEIGIAWNDPTLNIPWPIAEPFLSPRDQTNPTLAAAADRLPSY
jgi:dTDP-4-dehydrorhamnose 3,5-epimerase